MKHSLKRELIGHTIEVTESKNKDLIGIKGKIIDETKNTLVIKDKENKKVLLKEQITFKIEMNNKRIKIDGNKLTKKPEKRI